MLSFKCKMNIQYSYTDVLELDLDDQFITFAF